MKRGLRKKIEGNLEETEIEYKKIRKQKKFIEGEIKELKRKLGKAIK